MLYQGWGVAHNGRRWDLGQFACQPENQIGVAFRRAYAMAPSVDGVSYEPDRVIVYPARARHVEALS